jgi:hypothetical protein
MRGPLEANGVRGVRTGTRVERSESNVMLGRDGGATTKNDHKEV